MREHRSNSADSIFNNKGEVRHKTQLSPFFLRKPYQYTKAEPKDNDQQELHKDDWKKLT